MARILGIDPATACGWAVLDGSGARIASGTWDLKPRSGEGAGMRYVRFERYLRELIATYPGSTVVYEQVQRAHKSTRAGVVYGALVGHITRVCEELGLNYTHVNTSAVKRHATTKGNAGKPAMIAAALARWPFPVDYDDNEADALWIADAFREGVA